jgi:hypothetical protein
MCMFCRLLFVLFSFFFCPLFCLFFFDIRILITTLVSSSSSLTTSGTRRVYLVTNSVISRERGKDREVFTCGTYLRSFVIQIFHNTHTCTIMIYRCLVSLSTIFQFIVVENIELIMTYL